MATESAAPRSNVIPFPGAFHRQSRSTWRGANTLREARLAHDEDDDRDFRRIAVIALLEAYYNADNHVDGSYPNGDRPRILMASDQGDLELFDYMDSASLGPRPGAEIICIFMPNTCPTRIAISLREHVGAHRG